MKYKLRGERIQVMDGPHAGRQYIPGREYDRADIPDREMRHFEPASVRAGRKPASPVPDAQPVKPANGQTGEPATRQTGKPKVKEEDNAKS